MQTFFSLRNSNRFAFLNGSVALGAVTLCGLLGEATGCSSKKYVRAQTAPIVQQTNQLDANTAQDHRTIVDTDERATKGIAGAQTAADTAGQHADAAGQSADAAGRNAKEAYNRVDTLSGVIANLDNYKPLADVSVTFALNKYSLTKDDKAQLDQFAAGTTSAKGYILEVTGGTDTSGPADYNYQLSQRRADAVANYLQEKFNIAPHRFYLVGIGKDQQVATDKTAAGRQKNRRVQIRLLSNMSGDQTAPASAAPSGN